MRWYAGKHALDTEVFIDVGPMDALAGANQTKVCSLLGGRLRETPRPSERDADDPAVCETRDDLVLGDADVLDARLGASRSVHAMPPELPNGECG